MSFWHNIGAGLCAMVKAAWNAVKSLSLKEATAIGGFLASGATTIMGFFKKKKKVAQYTANPNQHTVVQNGLSGESSKATEKVAEKIEEIVDEKAVEKSKEYNKSMVKKAKEFRKEMQKGKFKDLKKARKDAESDRRRAEIIRGREYLLKNAEERERLASSGRRFRKRTLDEIRQDPSKLTMRSVA